MRNRRISLNGFNGPSYDWSKLWNPYGTISGTIQTGPATLVGTPLYNPAVAPEAVKYGYPYRNIIVFQDTMRVEFAVAGFDPTTDLQVTHEGDELVVIGNVTIDTGLEYFYRGISSRAFDVRMSIGKDSEITDVTCKNGILSVGIKFKKPEDTKSKPIAINVK